MMFLPEADPQVGVAGLAVADPQVGVAGLVVVGVLIEVAQVVFDIREGVVEIEVLVTEVVIVLDNSLLEVIDKAVLIKINSNMASRQKADISNLAER